jgi:DNA ligase 1
MKSGDWAKLTFRPFDIPTPGLTVEAAQAILRELPLPAHAYPVEYTEVQSTSEALAIMRRVVKAGGEGVMLRRPRSPYLTERRTVALLKMKPEIVDRTA